MSTFIDYDPRLTTVEKADVVPSTIGGGTVGSGQIGEDVSDWVPIKLATVTYAIGHDPDDNGTLIYGSETATVTKSYWRHPDGTYQTAKGDLVSWPPLSTGQKVRIVYDDVFEFLGTVDKVSQKRYDVPVGRRHGKSYAVSFTASILGTYAVALSRQVCWTELPGESAYDRITRFGVTVVNWP